MRFAVSQPWAERPRGVYARSLSVRSPDALIRFFLEFFETEGGLLSPLSGEHWVGSGTFSEPRGSYVRAYKKGKPPPPIPEAATGRYAYLYVPSWALCALGAALPAGRVVAWRRRMRRALRPGFCAACGYDLRATPNRCPECGVAAVKGDL